MLELLVLIGIAYAGARGVESIIGDRRQHNPAAEKTVKKTADLGPKNKTVDLTKKKEKRGPAEPGGTFSAAAPRAAGIGGKAAVPLAVAVETSATMWKATLEGYQQAWPEIRRERREKMAERARRRAAEKEMASANRRATDALAKAGPPPAYPPGPAAPPAGASDAPSRDAERRKAPAAEPDPNPGTPAQDAPAPDTTAPTCLGPAADRVLAAQKAAREAKEQAATAEERPATPEPAPSGRRHLTAVPTQNGDTMPGHSTLIPEIRTLDGLLNSLALIRAMSLMRAEEAQAVAADDRTLSDRLDAAEAELTDLEVDQATLAEIAELRESIHAQSKAAAQYGGAAQDTADHAAATAAAAHKTHGGIAEAVQSSPVEKAAQAGYYNNH